MDKLSCKRFDAIKEFVKVLCESFGKHNKPLALYNKLLESTTYKHVAPAMKHINCFDSFLKKYKSSIVSGKLSLPPNAKIIYNERIFVDLPAFLKKSDNATADVIKQHLLVIMSLLHPDDTETLDNLEHKLGSLGIDTSTKEGQFMNNIFSQVGQAMEGVDLSSDNPMGAVASLMNSGLIQNMMGGFQNGIQNGELDMSALMGTMQGMMKNLTGQMKDAGMDIPEMPNVLNASSQIEFHQLESTVDVPNEIELLTEIPDEITEVRDE